MALRFHFYPFLSTSFPREGNEEYPGEMPGDATGLDRSGGGRKSRKRVGPGVFSLPNFL